MDNIKISEHDERLMLNESHNKVMAEWGHFAVLSLFDVIGKAKLDTIDVMLRDFSEITLAMDIEKITERRPS